VRLAPGIPHALYFWGEEFTHDSGASRRGIAKMCLDWNTVIASEAKHSIAPRKGRMDCFVASLLA
jgi:hypothetical protein